MIRCRFHLDFPFNWNLKSKFSLLLDRPTPCLVEGNTWRRILSIDLQLPVMVEFFDEGFEIVLPEDGRKYLDKIINVVLDFHGLRDVKNLYDFMDKDLVLRKIKDRLYGFGGAGLMATSLYEGVIKAIIQQQISLKVAEGITANLVERYGDKVSFLGKMFYGFPSPDLISRLNVLDLRKCGLSRRKAEYIIEISKEVAKGYDLEGLRDKDDEEVIETLTSFKGIGRWSAELVMVATMGRNVIPADDLGVRKAISHFYFDGKLQPPDKIRDFAKRKFGRFLRDCLVYLLMAYRLPATF